MEGSHLDSSLDLDSGTTLWGARNTGKRNSGPNTAFLDACVVVGPGLLQPVRQNLYLSGLLSTVDKPNGHGSEHTAE